MITAAADVLGRVRLEAVSASTHLPSNIGSGILVVAKSKEVDNFKEESYRYADAIFAGKTIKVDESRKDRTQRGITKDSKELTQNQINCIVEGLK